MDIRPLSRNDSVMSYKQGTLHASLARIISVLGEPNYDDDPCKVENSWQYEVDGRPIAIWDWKGSHHFHQFSYYGDEWLMRRLFGDEAIEPFSM